MEDYCCDRRRYQRLKVNLSVWFRLSARFHMISLPADEEIEAQTLDLSQEGISIVTKYNIPIYAELIVSFILFRMDRRGNIIFNEPLELTGEIRSNILISNNERRLGIWFKNIASEQRSKITQYISSIAHNN